MKETGPTKPKRKLRITFDKPKTSAKATTEGLTAETPKTWTEEDEKMLAEIERDLAVLEKGEQINIGWAAETKEKENEEENEENPRRNEDATLVDENHRVFGIFDGMGGYVGGAVASQSTCEYFKNHLSEIPDGTNVETAKNALAKIIVASDVALREKMSKSPENSKMGTTAAILKIHNDVEGKNWAVIGSVGDSRVYKIEEDGTITQITLDDDMLVKFYPNSEERTKVAKKIANARKIENLGDDEERFLFKKRNQITEAIGRGASNPHVYSLVVKKGDRFLITSDGVHDNLTTEEIEETIRQSATLEDASKNLVQKSFARSKEPREKEMRAKKDDISAVLVEV